MLKNTINIIIIALAFSLLVGCVACSVSPHEPTTDVENNTKENNQNPNTDDGNDGSGEDYEDEASDTTAVHQTTGYTENKKQLLASIPEMDIYIYAHAIDGETRFMKSTFDEYMLGSVDIYLETKNEYPIWLYNRTLARSEFKLYYGNFFDNDQNYLILVDYEHGGLGGGSEKVIVFGVESYSIIPIKEEDWISYSCQLTVNNDVLITLFDNWTFKIPFDKLIKSYDTGNKFIIEEGHLVNYLYLSPSELFDAQTTNGQFTLCFKIDYILEDGEICIGAINFVENEEYYRSY